jgi:hypothetical protein
VTQCSECKQSHKWSWRTKQAGPKCIYHDPDNHVDKRLEGHRGLPEDCPGCLGRGTVDQKSFGRRAGDYLLTCRECKTQYYWSDK